MGEARQQRGTRIEAFVCQGGKSGQKRKSDSGKGDDGENYLGGGSDIQVRGPDWGQGEKERRDVMCNMINIINTAVLYMKGVKIANP